MEYRTLGKSGLKVSVLSFGCGAVGGLMVNGALADQERAVARAMEFGINYFDTAPMYGNGESERNLGRVLRNLNRRDVIVGTKVWVADPGNIARSIEDSLAQSLQRLGQDSVDLLQVHNPVCAAGQHGALTPTSVRGEVLPALERLRREGRTRFIGFTALGDTPDVRAVLSAFDTAQISFNMLNPSAGIPLPAGYPAQDYGQLLGHAKSAGVGTISIRVLAGGALSGAHARHPLGMASVEPIGSAFSYAADVARALKFGKLVDAGFAGSLVEASLRYVISNPDLCTTLVGLSTLEQLEYADQSTKRGPLSAEALNMIASVQHGFVGEQR